MKDLPATICRRANLLQLHSSPARSYGARGVPGCPKFTIRYPAAAEVRCSRGLPAAILLGAGAISAAKITAKQEYEPNCA